MGRWQFTGKDGVIVVIESDDDVLDDEATHASLKASLATAGDGWVAEAVVMQRFKETHEVDHAIADRSLDQVPLVATIKMRRRPNRIWT